VCYLATFVLLYVHPPQTGSMFPNTVKFNLLTIQFTFVACNLTADNSYHGTKSFIYCLLAVAILADLIWNGISICVDTILLCLVHSFLYLATPNLCSVVSQVSGSMDWLAGLVVLSQGWWIDRYLENKIKCDVYSTSK
jgi:hypothetical protein